MTRTRTAARLALAAALATTLTATACTGAQPGALSPSAPATTTAAGGETAPPGLEAYYTQKLAWSGCGDGFECARLEVPLDYDEPEGERMKLSVIRLPATGDRIGSIVLNPGGPGGSGVGYARAATSVLTAGVRARFDTVGFDPRGVGESTPAIRCLTTSKLDAYVGLDNTPDTPGERTALEEGSRRFASGCDADSGKLLPHVGTVDAARDMDILRAALGDKGLTYLGKSYGTFLGAMYADLFPTRVRALVLDGAVDPSLSPVELNETQAEGFEVALRSFLQDCFNDAACPFSSRDVDGAIEELRSLLQRADREPLRNGLGDGRRITEAWVTLGIIAPLYDRRSWPVLRQALSHAFNGDGTTLLRLADLLIDRRQDGTYSNQTEANMAINCVDNVYPRTPDTYEKAAEQAEKEAPLFGAPVMWGSLPCAFWPVPSTRDVKTPLDAQGAPPIVVVGTERDPATPYRWAEALAEELSSGVLLGFDGDGHTAYMTGSTCVDKAVDDYLINLKPPADGTRCPKVN
ncbi:pimeloyl-ACP methyl ester carboxylesterase [Thermocatellispora tengchongensis]|uniref:Pimeloyl-ACP methyl ester carboxylesterase n=1 Tax=Thermocatellispora tengchongensis TaxID=1073253 RepID=A0A840PX63_9ACTN|nr:alpha/beta hydrolase [Thermocatellispora tengchongensis]MBB5140445.1 pimeloyl-ACP methyl ester carboxylesterase [Thermocatellispora tengchongensis]